MKFPLKTWKKTTQNFTVVMAVENSQLHEDYYKLVQCKNLNVSLLCQVATLLASRLLTMLDKSFSSVPPFLFFISVFRETEFVWSTHLPNVLCSLLAVLPTLNEDIRNRFVVCEGIFLCLFLVCSDFLPQLQQEIPKW